MITVFEEYGVLMLEDCASLDLLEVEDTLCVVPCGDVTYRYGTETFQAMLAQTPRFPAFIDLCNFSIIDYYDLSEY